MSNSNYYDYHSPDRTPDTTSHHSSTPSWVVGLVAGAALGSGLALLFAPRQGAVTRHQLAERSQQAGRQVRHAYESVAGTARRNARRLTAQAQDWRRQRASGASDSIYAEYGETSEPRSAPSRVLRDAVGEATYTPAHVAPDATGPGVTSPAPADSRSPFA